MGRARPEPESEHDGFVEGVREICRSDEGKCRGEAVDLVAHRREFSSVGNTFTPSRKPTMTQLGSACN